MHRLALVTVLLLAASSALASDLSLAVTYDKVVRAGFPAEVTFMVHNPGPDVAKNVNVTISSNDIEFQKLGSPADMPVPSFLPFAARFTPGGAGTITFTATLPANAPDDLPANNVATATLTVSTDPDLFLVVQAPVRQDLALPFTLDLSLGNTSKSDAHDVDLTVDFRPDVVVTSVPSGCVNSAAGHIACHPGLVRAGQSALDPPYTFGMVAPPDFGIGVLIFNVVVTEAEHDFNPNNNEQKPTTALFRTFYVTSTANEGEGTLRQAILDSNIGCLNVNIPCAIGFRIAEPSPTPWKTIRVTSPLPAIVPVTPVFRVDGTLQHVLLGGGNPDGPDIETSAAGNNVDDGLTVGGCGVEVSGLAINGFARNGVAVIADAPTQCGIKATLHHLFVGTDPTGSAARPNLRGIATAVPNDSQFNSASTVIHDCVISGNLRSGVFGLSGRLSVFANRIGVKAHADEPLPNGNAGVYVGPGGYGSDIGSGFFLNGNAANVIAFNGQMGVAVAASTGDVAIRDNRIWGNGGLGIDVALDGPQSSAVPVPVLTLAHYDPVAKQTVIEGDVSSGIFDLFGPRIDFYANDAARSEGQRPLGSPSTASQSHFRFTVDGDLTGQFITATSTHVRFVGFAKPATDGTTQGFLTQTSEFSRPIEVR